MYLYFEKLDWADFDDINDIKRAKENLLKNDALPKVLKDMLCYIRSVAFDEIPNYDYLFDILYI